MIYRGVALVALETPVFFQEIHEWLLHLITKRTHFFAYIVGKRWLFAAHGLEAKNFCATATRWDRTCACCQGSQGVHIGWLTTSWNGRVGSWRAVHPAISNHGTANDQSPSWGYWSHLSKSAKGFAFGWSKCRWWPRRECHSHIARHDNWDTGADGLPASGYHSTLQPSEPKWLSRFRQRLWKLCNCKNRNHPNSWHSPWPCCDALPVLKSPPSGVLEWQDTIKTQHFSRKEGLSGNGHGKSPPSPACTFHRVHALIPQLQGQHYAQPST